MMMMVAAKKLIPGIIGEFELGNDVEKRSQEILSAASLNAAIVTKRIRDLSLALACVYIAMRSGTGRQVRQEDFAWHFKTSTTTIRKTYRLLCAELSFDRDMIKSKYLESRRKKDGKSDQSATG